jgi:hypothetical protein
MREAQKNSASLTENVWKKKSKEYENRIDAEIERVERILAARTVRKREEQIITDEIFEIKIKEWVKTFNENGMPVEVVEKKYNNKKD